MTDDYNDDGKTGLGARDTCVSKNFQMENQSQSSSVLKDFNQFQKQQKSILLFLVSWTKERGDTVELEKTGTALK